MKYIYLLAISTEIVQQNGCSCLIRLALENLVNTIYKRFLFTFICILLLYIGMSMFQDALIRSENTTNVSFDQQHFKFLTLFTRCFTRY